MLWTCGLPFFASVDIESSEAGGLALLSSALALPITPSNGHHIRLSDIRNNAIVSDDVHACPTRLICLENTLGGTILPLEDCSEIAQWAREQDPQIPMHLDGARLWDAVTAGAGTLKEYCSCFDSVSLCFSKGLGAPIGSIIVGKRIFIEKARHFRKAIGGGLRQAGVIAAAARVSVEETFLAGKLSRSQELAQTVAKMWEIRGGKLLKPRETGMVWLDLAERNVTKEAWIKAALEAGVTVMGPRLVCHYQIGHEAIARLVKAMNIVMGCNASHAINGNPTYDSKAVEQETKELTEQVAS